MGSVRLREVVPHGGSTVPSTDVIQLTLTLQMITARQSMSMQQSYLVLRQPSDDHAHPTHRSTYKKIGEEKKNSSGFYTELDLIWKQLWNYYSFLKTHKLKIPVTFSVFWG